MQLSLVIDDFYFFYNGPVDNRILALLTRSQRRVSDTQVTIEAHRRPVVCAFLFYWWRGRGVELKIDL